MRHVRERASIPSFTDKAEEFQAKRLETEEEVRGLLRQQVEPFEAVLLIDNLQRLGIDYHFRDEIDQLLLVIRESLLGSEEETHHGLHFAALSFCLLRQHGYYVSTTVLNRYRINSTTDGGFDTHDHDIAGMLALYEASFVRLEGEDKILDEARNFSQSWLRSLLDDVEPSVKGHIEYILDHPFHLSIPRFNIKHYLETSRGAHGKNRTIYELAKLDFNVLQSAHQIELQEVARWWRGLGLRKELKFERENFVEWYIWPLIAIPEPQFSALRIEMAKPVALLFLIDDIFDIYGTLDELILFTEAVERWEVESTKPLPRFMRMSFMALYNSTNDIAGTVLKEHGWNPIKALRETWAAMCRAFLAEKGWLTSGNLPESEVYLRNGMISSGVPMVFIHLFVLLGEGKKMETADLLTSGISDLILHSAMIFRLWNDMKRTKDDKERGHDGSYTDCYINECGGTSCTSLESAKELVVWRLNDAWKKLNAKCLFASPYSSVLRKASLNVARMAEVTYSYEDAQRQVALKDLAVSLLMESIPL